MINVCVGDHEKKVLHLLANKGSTVSQPLCNPIGKVRYGPYGLLLHHSKAME